MKPKSITELYAELPTAYAAIANDRDFVAQAAYLLQISGILETEASQPPLSCLELFAGPGCHARVITRNSGYRAYGIDSSSAMKQFACRNGELDPHRYAVADLPCQVEQLFPGISFHLIFAPRYSLGYIRPAELNALFSSLFNVLSHRGAIVFEIHQPEAIATRFEHLPIRERTAQDANHFHYKCIWPHGSLRTGLTEGEVTMSVRLSVTDPSGSITEMLFESDEFLYTIDHLEAAARKLDLQTLSYRDERVFPGSLLVLHRQSIEK